LETIPTNRGKALIVSGPWGWVRHPNYVGDIIMNVAIAATTGCTHFMPMSLPLGTALFLVLRAWDDEDRLRTKYGSAWTRYCQRVPNRFIPKIF
jgi:protein-S-isoprenylcysteine O-methyltransferase Ste14